MLRIFLPFLHAPGHRARAYIGLRTLYSYSYIHYVTCAPCCDDDYCTCTALLPRADLAALLYTDCRCHCHRHPIGVCTCTCLHVSESRVRGVFVLPLLVVAVPLPLLRTASPLHVSASASASESESPFASASSLSLDDIPLPRQDEDPPPTSFPAILESDGTCCTSRYHLPNSHPPATRRGALVGRHPPPRVQGCVRCRAAAAV